MWMILTNKNKLQFILDDSQPEGDKGDHYGTSKQLLCELAREFL